MLLAVIREPEFTKLVLLFGLACARCGAIEPPLPAEASFLPELMKVHLRYEAWNEMPFPVHGGRLHSGKHWGIEGTMSGAADSGSAWRMLKTAFIANGWILETEFPDPKHFYATLHFAQNRLEAWANIEIIPADDVRIDLLEPGPPPHTLILPTPKSKPERIDTAKGDFPYMIPLPGSKLSNSKSDTAPFVVSVAGASQPELITTGSITKSYAPPEGVSGPLFVVEYRTALTEAGWAIANESTGPDASIVAHFGKGRRNLWANLRWSHDGYQIQIAEPNGENLGKALSANCHAALYGLLFNFSDATRDPSSLTLSPSETNGSQGETFIYTATATSTVPGSFHWQIVKEKEIDDPSAFTLTASSCAGQTTCNATLRMDHPGFADVNVSFHPANATQISQAESVPVLRQVLELLKHRRRLQIEVQGHTDDVGTDAYDQLLSDTQAAAVVEWLTQSGIAARRLTSNGYGKTQPVADNSSAQGRAMNHRIEIADRRCVPKDL